MPLSDFVHPESPAYLKLTGIAAQPNTPHKIMTLLHYAESYIALGCYAAGLLLLEEVVAAYDALQARDDCNEQMVQYACNQKGPTFSPRYILRNFIEVGEPDKAYAIYWRWYKNPEDGRLSQQEFLKRYR